MAVTSLVILDLKEIDDDKHRALTGQSNKQILKFARFIDEHNVPIWVRHVVVPTITDNADRWYRLGFFAGSLKNLETIDCLPYHVMGTAKYKEMGIALSPGRHPTGQQSLSIQSIKSGAGRDKSVSAALVECVGTGSGIAVAYSILITLELQNKSPIYLSFSPNPFG